MSPTVKSLKQDKLLKTQIETAKTTKHILRPNMQLLKLLPWLTTFVFVDQSLASSVNSASATQTTQTPDNNGGETESMEIIRRNSDLNKSLILVSNDYFLLNDI